MKKMTLLLGTFLSMVLISCTGDPGPPGRDGFDGVDGVDGLDGEPAQVFEVEGVNLGYNDVDNIFQTALAFQDYTNFEVLPEDAVLVYRFDGVIEFEDGNESNAWGQLPQNFFLNEGTLQYVVSHTDKDVEILIDGNFDLSGISTDFTDDQVFRVVIVPGIAASQASFDEANISDVMKTFGLVEKDVKKIRLNP